MSDIAIRVEGLSKLYKIGKLQRRHDTLRDRIADARLFNLFKRRNGGEGQRAKGEEQPPLPLAPSSLPPPDTIWALKDVSFEVKRGEVVGIIGRNGAGKSTLLKILSRITEPTSGYADINGRIASLLEVGTGFHPELTGRENIYLNGSILGMKRAEINQKFDEIVSFAEIEKFIDTPVKYYSSGMYVRLAFAVAAHLEPEILLVDEVLAVGDAQFQKKCLGKIGDVAREGRTVLFVSHNMGAIRGLCRRVAWVDQGAVKAEGDPPSTISQYLESVSSSNNLKRVLTPFGDLEVTQVILKNDRDKSTSVFRSGEALTVEIHCTATAPVESPYFWVGIESPHGSLFAGNMLLDGQTPTVITGESIVKCRFKCLPLLPQVYTVNMGVRDKGGSSLLVKTGEVASFKIIDSGRELGLMSDHVDTVAWLSSPVLVPYQWYLPDGRVLDVDVSRKFTKE